MGAFVSSGYMNLWVVLGFGFCFNEDIFFSRLLTRIFRSTSSFCSSATVGLDTNPPSLSFGQTHNKTGNINEICAGKNVIDEQIYKNGRF